MPKMYRFRRVLIVDPNQAFAADLQERLQIDGYEATIVASGEVAESIFALAVYEFVLVELDLPDTNGFRLARHLLRQETGALVAAMTPKWSVEAARNSAETGCCTLLSKPFSAEALLAVLHQAELSRKPDRRN